MIEVRYPQPRFRIKKEGHKSLIFDPIRKSWLFLTEEEWVRQNFISYLFEGLHYPVSFIAVEKEILLNELKKRFDILVYNKDFKPWMLVECKAPSVPLSEEVLQQVLRYNITVPVHFIVITNGPSTIGWERNERGLFELKDMPEWE
jgi:hypothetical protein